MGSDHEAEIRASVGAYHDLGTRLARIRRAPICRARIRRTRTCRARIRGIPVTRGPCWRGHQAPVPRAHPALTVRRTTQRGDDRHRPRVDDARRRTTAIVAHSARPGQAVMVLLIWAAIAIVNIAYARRC